ncbi:MAG: RibD family protein [Terrimicrobiaceae bacterium]
MKSPARPHVIANFAITADGKVSTHRNSPTTFTSPEDKKRLREIRALGDGLLAGAGTVASDSMSMGITDPTLQARRLQRGQTREPVRVIVTNSGLIHPGLKVFQNDRTPLVIFSTTAMPQDRRSRFPAFCDLWLFQTRTVPLLAALHILHADYGLKTIVCEGGPRLFRSLAAVPAIDELYVTFCPRTFGGHHAPTLTGLPGPLVFSPAIFLLIESKTVGDEFHTHFVAQTSKVG